ncbi:MAG: S26 family signal peptidase [Candidatus Rokubacteria bacterium]|nr:S26 family signal peptidase [Candidatus Rokubacteria bacterium]
MTYLRTVGAHACQYWAPWTSLLAGILYFGAHFTVGVNATPSLPYTLCIIVKGEFTPRRGDLVAFRWQGGGPYPAGAVFSKFVRGVPGDEVIARGREFFVNGQPVGSAKPFSAKREPLAPGPTGVIPEGRYYVAGSHPDSLDSRYALAGWIRHEALIGKAHVVF